MEQQIGVSEKKVKSAVKKTKIRRRYLCKLLKKKRTKVGCCFSHIPDDFLLSKIPSRSKMMIPGPDVLFNQNYFPEKYSNLEKEFVFPTENIMDSAKLKSCNLNKISHSSPFVNSSSHLHKMQMQILKLYKRNQETFSRTRSETSFSRLMRTKPFGGKMLSKSMFDLCHFKSKSEEDKKTLLSNSASYCSFDLSDPLSQRFPNSKIHPTQYSNLDLSAGAQSNHNFVSPVKNTFRRNSDMSPYYFRTMYPINFLSRHEDRASHPPRGGQSLIARSRGHSEGIPSSRYHPISTRKARERNYLRGRVAVTSLLGSSELERSLPRRELRIFVGTWNMNGQVPQQLNDFLLPPALENVSDVIVVGTQESFSERAEWEVRVQETVGPSHLLYHSTMLGSLHLVVFIRRDLIWFCSLPEDASYSIRPAASFKTKGAVAIGFLVFGSSYLFITSHLSAHTSKIKERVHEVKKITRSLDLPKKLPARHKSEDVTQNFDYVFWCGDLNFRLSESREEIMHWVKQQNFPLHRPTSMHSDQLKRKISEGVVFRDFLEGPITFPPTYKYNLGSQTFDTSHKLRSPAYTDRILYKCRGRCALKCLLYTSVQSICTSDHKPVWGLYTSVVRPGIDSIPLAAGLFNREVYLEAIRRRATAMDGSEGSAICSIQ